MVNVPSFTIRNRSLVVGIIWKEVMDDAPEDDGVGNRKINNSTEKLINDDAIDFHFTITTIKAYIVWFTFTSLSLMYIICTRRPLS